MQINGNYKSVSHFSFFAALKFTHWSSKAEGYTSAPNSKLLQTEKFGNLTYLWCLEGFPNADRVIVHVMKTEVEPQQTGFLFFFKLCMPGWCICNIQKWIFSLLPKQELSDYVVYKCTQWPRSATFTEWSDPEVSGRCDNCMAPDN